MARHAADLPSDPAVVVTNPDDEVSDETFRAWLDHRQSAEPASPAVRAAETLAEVRALGEYRTSDAVDGDVSSSGRGHLANVPRI